MVSAICVSGTYVGNNIFCLEICVTVVLKVLAKVEMLVPSYGFCEVPPCEEFASSVCDEFFSLPLFPQALCDEDAIRARNVSCTCGNYTSTTGLGCSGEARPAQTTMPAAAAAEPRRIPLRRIAPAVLLSLCPSAPF